MRETSPSPFYVYCFVRRDLSLPQQVVQACHACIESIRNFLPPSAAHPHLVLLSARSRADLESISARLDAFGIRCCIFCEPDLAGEPTALSTEPISGSRRSVFKRYRCWTGDTHAPDTPEVGRTKRSDVPASAPGWSTRVSELTKQIKRKIRG